MSTQALFLSVKPIYANRILEGTKTIELRRMRPHVVPGQCVLIYSSSPEMSLVGRAIVQDIMCNTPDKLWSRVRQCAGISRADYDAYFIDAITAIGIRLGRVQRLAEPISLCEMRTQWPWLRPPQSYRFVKAKFEHSGKQIVMLEPG